MKSTNGDSPPETGNSESDKHISDDEKTDGSGVSRWPLFRGLIVAAGVVGLASFAFSTNSLVWKAVNQRTDQNELGSLLTHVRNLERESEGSTALEMARLAAQADERLQAMRVKEIQACLGLTAGASLIFLGGMLLCLVLTEIPYAVQENKAGSLRASTPAVALMVVGALLTAWCTSENFRALLPQGGSQQMEFLTGY